MSEAIDQGVPLEGGVASDVRLVETADGPLVIKRALTRLKVEAEWFSDPARSLVEVAAIDAFASLGEAANVPAVVWARPEEHCFAMRLVDPRLHNWKLEIMAGRVDLETARRVGEVLGTWHANSRQRPELAARFADIRFFQELRIEPFFEYVAAALPELSSRILGVASAMLRRRIALVHGDYSPKNILADGADVVILDFEVTHWGDPRFDIGFCLAHLILKSAIEGADREMVSRAIAAFLGGYLRTGLEVCDAHLAHITGCLLLARLCGKSPAEYGDRIDRGLVESKARSLLATHGKPTPDSFFLYPEQQA